MRSEYGLSDAVEDVRTEINDVRIAVENLSQIDARTYLAGQVLQAVIPRLIRNGVLSKGEAATIAVGLADAVLAALAKPRTPSPKEG